MIAMTTPDESLEWMRDGTGRVLACVAGLPDAALTGPTALPGWTRRYLVAHLAANAEALRNLVHWARSGEERPMYGSPEQRAEDIAAGALRPVADLRAWLTSSADDLAGDLAGLSGDDWEAKIVTAQGLTRPAAEIPWMRAREVYIHAIDLNAGIGWADLPADFLTTLLDEVTARRSAVGGGPALALGAIDTGDSWTVAGVGAPVPVSGPLASLAGYLAGRPVPGLEAAPALPPWL
jgi:maleylpyruvate isomerase